MKVEDEIKKLISKETIMRSIGREIHRIEAVKMQFKLFFTSVCKSYYKLVPFRLLSHECRPLNQTT